MQTLLITGANSMLARAVVAAQRPDRRIRMVDAAFDMAIEGTECLTGDLREESFVEQILDGVTEIVHLAPLYTTLATDSETLEHATRGTYQLANAAAAAGVQRLVLGSTLDLFEPFWDRFRVDESWRPRPLPKLEQLCPYLSEVTLREVTRETGVTALCLRFGQVVDNATAEIKPYDPRWVHVDDAATAVERALQIELQGWGVFHIAAAGEQARAPVARAQGAPFKYTPTHDFRARWHTRVAADYKQPQPIGARPIRKVILFGAGGPLAVSVTQELSQDYTLRLTDVGAVEDLATREPQAPGAPLPVPPQPPHEWRVVDVRDPEQVMAACEGMDAIINCSVIRYGSVDTFRVNMLGAYNVMRAAVAHGIKRVVHTGPYMVGQHGPAGYEWDTWIVDEVPPRPGTWWIYFPSKLLGQEICRVFAEAHGLEVPALAFCQFLNHQVKHGEYLHPLSVSWDDAARAIRCALEVPTLPSPYEYFHIGADLPHDVYPNEKAKRLLGWEPRHQFTEYYARRD